MAEILEPFTFVTVRKVDFKFRYSTNDSIHSKQSDEIFISAYLEFVQKFEDSRGR